VFTYPDPDLTPDYTAICEGTPENNGFYGEGIVDALAASSKHWGESARRPSGRANGSNKGGRVPLLLLFRARNPTPKRQPSHIRVKVR
jgi:hypothetical protein